MSNLKSKSIIAMKGHPFTRKTTFAKQIAVSLKCPVLALDDFLSPDYSQSSASSAPSTQPRDVPFGIICQMAKTNLSTGLFQNIVIDSPLSSRSHLDQLIELASSLDQTRLVIVECKAASIYAWQTRFEDYISYNPDWTHNPYKAKNWEDVEKAIKDGYDERSDGYTVSKLLFDPISDYQVSANAQTLPFIDAVKYMITRNESVGPDLVVYRRWLHGQYLPCCDNEEESDDGQSSVDLEGMQLGPCIAGSGHYITNYIEEGLEYEAICMACENPVMGVAYTCKLCTFVLHKECSELLDKNNKLSNYQPAADYLDHRLKKGIRFVYPRLKYRCRSCKDNDSNLIESDSSCGDCLFTTHLRKRLMPTVIRHECDEHFLSVVLSDLDPNGEYCQCKACGEAVKSVWYSCKICSVAYHYTCLVIAPVRVEHEHGGYHHHMLLQYSTKEAEDYLCDICFESEDPEGTYRRDPRLWFYSCQECQYHAHFRCGLRGSGESEYFSRKYTYFQRLRTAEGSKRTVIPRSRLKDRDAILS